MNITFRLALANCTVWQNENRMEEQYKSEGFRYQLGQPEWTEGGVFRLRLGLIRVKMDD